jgi:hypothetical protein
MLLKEKQKHGDDDGDDLELTVQPFGGSASHYKIKKGDKLKDFIKRNKIKTKGFLFKVNGKEIAVDEETGELNEDYTFETNSVLTIYTSLTGGIR